MAPQSSNVRAKNAAGSGSGGRFVVSAGLAAVVAVGAVGLLYATRRAAPHPRPVATTESAVAPGSATPEVAATESKPLEALPDATPPPASASAKAATASAASEAAMTRARQLMEKGDAQGALGALQAALVDDPSNAAILTEVGFLYLDQMHDHGAAISSFEKAAAAAPDNANALLSLAREYVAADASERGLAFLRELATSHPEATGADAAIGAVLVETHRAGEALPYLERAATKADHPALGYADLASAQSLSGNAAQAAQSYAKAIAAGETQIKTLEAAGKPTATLETWVGRTELEMARAQMKARDFEAAAATLQRATEHGAGAGAQALATELANARRG
jgi:tetratricopeptide (TPR) repeat protein